jgi:uncharacterized membrane protein
MNRKELMAAVALAAGISLGVSAAPSMADHKASHNPAAAEHANPQGFIKSGNPKAAGGPDNPGRGNPFTPY